MTRSNTASNMNSFEGEREISKLTIPVFLTLKSAMLTLHATHLLHIQVMGKLTRKKAAVLILSSDL